MIRETNLTIPGVKERLAFPTALKAKLKGFRYHDFRDGPTTVVLRRPAIPDLRAIQATSDYNDFTGWTNPARVPALLKETEQLPATLVMVTVELAVTGLVGDRSALDVTCWREEGGEQLSIRMSNDLAQAPLALRESVMASLIDHFQLRGHIRATSINGKLCVEAMREQVLELFDGGPGGTDPGRFSVKVACADALARCAIGAVVGKPLGARLMARADAKHVAPLTTALAALPGFLRWEIASEATVSPQSGVSAPLGEWLHKDGRFLQCDERPNGIAVYANFDCTPQLSTV